METSAPCADRPLTDIGVFQAANNGVELLIERTENLESRLCALRDCTLGIEPPAAPRPTDDTPIAAVRPAALELQAKLNALEGGLNRCSDVLARLEEL